MLRQLWLEYLSFTAPLYGMLTRLVNQSAPFRPLCAVLRRFLLEWLSFLYRYVPVGLLERVPQVMQWRPPAFCGRSDLETLLAR